MFSRMLNDYDEIPHWDAMPMHYPCPMMSQPPYDLDNNARQEQFPTTTGQTNLNFQPTPPIQKDMSYTQGWLTSQIGKYVKIEFLIGTNMWIDREGILKEVGISYVVIEEAGTNNTLMCDIYSIKFVTVFRNQEKAMLCK
ncbi:hypothetical protein [Clostridium brassicae]|uniref:Spore coat protein GerQ n=1 Tax=Clostridium brassicae TaxID=2999072 RepID=A0ABT4DDA1_9CLOT|nr:hypothetical protein [Clostridium brassicae]MCY6960299.1 hypothetical protein [Clostridium brassicae]